MLVKKRLFKPLSGTLLAAACCAAAPLAAHAESSAELANALIKLQHELLSAKEQVARFQENQGINVYLDSQDQHTPALKEIRLFIDEQPIISHSLTKTELHTLAVGGIKKLYNAPLKPGKHELKVELIEEPDQEKPTIKSLSFNQGNNEDIIKITFSKFLGRQKIKLEHTQGPTE